MTATQSTETRRCPRCGRIPTQIVHRPEGSTAWCLDGHEWDPFAVTPCDRATCAGWLHAGALSQDVTALAAERDALQAEVRRLRLGLAYGTSRKGARHVDVLRAHFPEIEPDDHALDVLDPPDARTASEDSAEPSTTARREGV